MADLKQLQYVGGPFDGGTAPDDFLDGIEMRSPAGCGEYVRTVDEGSGLTVFQWKPEGKGAGQDVES